MKLVYKFSILRKMRNICAKVAKNQQIPNFLYHKSPKLRISLAKTVRLTTLRKTKIAFKYCASRGADL
jgi:hypothetical protein